MQNTVFYVAANETLGVVRDYVNAKSASAPTLVRGVEACLKIRLFANKEGTTPYPLSAFDNIASWTWAMDTDFNESTAYKLVGDNDEITVSSITETIDGETYTYTEVTIPMSEMNTEELAKWLGTEKSKNGLAGELVGFDVEARQVFILQIENFTVRNRITSLGDPTEITPEYLTEAQVRALFAAGMECEFSSDGENWHPEQTASDRYVHMRLRGQASGVWSDPIQLIQGTKGDTGKDSFCYVAYAQDATGTGFSLEPANGLKFRAEIHVDAVIETPTAEDFAEAKWIKYCGDDGKGVGDMVKSVYDPDDDGKVLSAEESDHAASADAVAWSGITEKPERFLPSGHEHTMSDISNPVWQKVYSASNPETLYLNTPIFRNTASNSSGTIPLNFTGIKTKVDGTDYRISEDQMLTWEYHVLCSSDVSGVTLGSESCTMVGINIPETIPLVNTNPTYHVFVIRAVYRYDAVNYASFQANYAYSYEA